jgi:hypothetical protein
MAIETILTDLDNSFSTEEILIRTIAETNKSLNGDTRYSAFIATSTTLPKDGVPIAPDQFTVNYANEALTLDDFGIGQAPYEDKFGKSRGTGFRYQKGDGSIGYFIEYDLEVTVADASDIAYVLSTFNEVVEVNDVLHVKKKIDYEGTEFDSDWAIVNSEV